VVCTPTLCVADTAWEATLRCFTALSKGRDTSGILINWEEGMLKGGLSGTGGKPCRRTSNSKTVNTGDLVKSLKIKSFKVSKIPIKRGKPPKAKITKPAPAAAPPKMDPIITPGGFIELVNNQHNKFHTRIIDTGFQKAPKILSKSTLAAFQITDIIWETKGILGPLKTTEKSNPNKKANSRGFKYALWGGPGFSGVSSCEAHSSKRTW